MRTGQLTPLRDVLVLADAGTWGKEADSTSGVPVLRSTNIVGSELRLDDVAWRALTSSHLVEKKLAGGDILVTASSGSPDHIGKCCVFDGAAADRTYYFSNFMLRLRTDPERANPRWLYHWLKSDRGRAALTAMNSTTSGLRNLNRDLYLSQGIPLPPIADQARIAAMLDKADGIRRKRQESLRLLDELLRSAFREMFGDPVRNEKGWEVRPLAGVAQVDRGRFTPRPRNDPQFYGGDKPFIQTGDIAGAGGVLRTWRQTLNEKGAAVSRRFSKGTIAISIAANIGDSAIVDFDFFCPDSVVGIVSNSAIVNTEYLEACLQFFKPSLEARAPMTAQRNINLGVLRPLRIPIPPLHRQTAFQGVHHRVVALKSRMRGALSDAGCLIESIANQAFHQTPA